VIGTAATEIVHIGQRVMGTGATIDVLIEAVFNYPTFADAYKTAALDAMNRLYALDGADSAFVQSTATRGWPLRLSTPGRMRNSPPAASSATTPSTRAKSAITKPEHRPGSSTSLRWIRPSRSNVAQQSRRSSIRTHRDPLSFSSSRRSCGSY